MADNRPEAAYEDANAVESLDGLPTEARLGRRPSRFVDDGFDTGVKIQGMSSSPLLQEFHKFTGEEFLTFNKS